MSKWLLISSCVSFLWSVACSVAAMKHLQQRHLALAAQQAQLALIFPKTFNVLTFNLIADSRLWQISLDSLINLQHLQNSATNYSQTIFIADDNHFAQSSQLLLAIKALTKNLQDFQQTSPHSFIVKKYIPADFLKNLVILSLDSQTLSEHFLTGKHQYLIILQNNQELRATGGFMGSFAHLQLNHGQIENLIIEDIYEPTGQFTGFVEAPAGIKEYLSSGQGMKLPDANWHPDFPSSAKQILYYFALGKQQDIEGIITISLNLIEDLLEITGPLYLPDSKLTIDHNNFAILARENRKNFFPGSQEKTNFLAEALNQIKFKLSALNHQQTLQLGQLLINSLDNKTIQLYSNDLEIQTLFEKYDLAGTLKTVPNPNTIANIKAYLTQELSKIKNQHTPLKKTEKTRPGEKIKLISEFKIQNLDQIKQLASQNIIPLMLVESNVGINKANKAVTREIFYKIKDQVLTIDINFSNNNQKPQTLTNDDFNPYYNEAKHLAYINYQRLITHPDLKVKRIAWNNQEITNFNEELITNSQGQEFKQIGFLITLAEQKKANLTIELIIPNNFSDIAEVYLQQQSGI